MNQAHEKSAKSVEPYLINLYKTTEEINAIRVLGKPFGIPRLLEYLGYDKEIVKNGFLTLTNNQHFAHVEQTLGNALGVAQGIAMQNPKQIVWCFISDSQLFMGPTLEAILGIGAMNLKNVWLCVDYNKLGSRGRLPDFNFEGIFWNWNIKYVEMTDQWFNPEIGDKPKVWVFNSFRLFK